MIKKTSRNELRVGKKQRIRRKLSGCSETPRLCVFRSLNHIYAQVIDDVKGTTLVAASTLDQELRDSLAVKSNTDAAKAVGALIAKKALANGIETVVFDRSGYKYHGRVAALADAAREAGLRF
ncbi:MAG: 50S ribosomal protein L18 [Solirubrobacterales bacterium]